jgi:hypothetical protein
MTRGHQNAVSHGFRPLQHIPESEKNWDWAVENMDYCIAQCPTYYANEYDEQYDRYNGKRDRKKMNHLTNTFGPEFPINKIKHYPLVRTLLNELQGEYEELKLDFTVFFTDTDSIKMKHELVKVNLLDAIVQAIKAGEDVDQTLDELEKNYKEKFQTSLEKGVWNALTSYVQNNQMERKFVENFVDKLITGEEYYRVQVNRIGEDPDYTVIRPGHLFFADNKTKWVRDCDWAVYPVEMTPIEILDSFGEYLTEDDKNKITDWVDMYTKDSLKFMDEFHPERTINSQEELQLMRPDNASSRTTVYYVEWKSLREINYLEMPNKYVSDAPFIKMVSAETIQELPGSRKKYLRKRFIEERYSGIRIADSIYCKLGKDKYVTRNPSRPSKCYLTFNGLTYAGSVKPSSFMKMTDDLQDTYDILHFHRENLLALSGVRGSIMDVSQLPDFGTGNLADNLKLYLYYKKLGVALINSAREGAGAYNQFGSYDDTLGQGYATILAAISQIEDMAGRLVGVNRQRLGNLTYRDGKATTESAQFQASLITQGMYNEHYEVVRFALEDIANACRIAWKNGYTGAYMSNTYTQLITTLEPEWSLSSYGIHIDNKVSEKRTVEEMKGFAMQVMREGMLEFQDVIPLFRKGNLSDILSHIEHSMTKRKQQMMEQQAQMQQLEGQVQQAETEGKVELIKAQIAKLMSDMEDNKRKLALEERELNDNRNKDMMDFNNESARIALEAKQLDVQAFKGNSAEVRNN